ncbi:MAG: hypothetical protein IKI64_10270 [Clostridia bacterium]|nr:hypothetical protein [Clostridia bacterium]
MKKFSEKRTLSLVVLIAVALIVIPLLGGLGLKITERRAAKEFSSIAATTDSHGNDLFSETDRLIYASNKLLEEGKRLNPDGGVEFENWASELENAIESCRDQKDAIGRYTSYESLFLTAKRFYNRVKSADSSELEACMSNMDEISKGIERAYRYEYNDYRAKYDSLVSRWPGSLLAKLFGIGGGEK